MEKSNINGESNIYPSRRNPLTDRKFVSQIEDYEYIKDIDKMQKLRQISDVLTQKQKQILVTEMRCVYAKHDPCWGYINGEGIRCKCIESECPNLIKCNPQYTLEEKEYWTMSEEEKKLYEERLNAMIKDSEDILDNAVDINIELESEPVDTIEEEMI